MKRNLTSPRSAAAVAVERICCCGAYSNLVLAGAGLAPADRPFFTALVRGTVERLRTLRYVVGLYVKRPPDRMTEAVLCTGIYQILYMDRIPDSAACNESVRAARELVSAREAGFVNAVLRSVCRDRASLPGQIAAQPDGVRYSLSDSLCERIREQYPDRCADIFASFFEPDGLPLCVNTRRIAPMRSWNASPPRAYRACLPATVFPSSSPARIRRCACWTRVCSSCRASRAAALCVCWTPNAG